MNSFESGFKMTPKECKSASRDLVITIAIVIGMALSQGF